MSKSKIMKIERVLTYVFLASLAIWLLRRTACHGCSFHFPGGKKGSGHVVSDARSVGSFSEIEATAVVDIILKQGDSPSIKLEGDDNLLADVKTEIEGSRLKISMPDMNMSHSSGLKAFITVKNLDALEVTGVSQVTCESPLALDRLKLDFTGVGGVNLRGTCNDAEIRNTGVGDVDALDFICKNLAVENSGTGNVKCRADGELSIQNSGVGNVEYSGAAVVKSVSSTGVGGVKKI